MARKDKRHIQMWMSAPLADAVERYADAHGGIAFTATVYVLLARALRAEGYELPGADHEHASQDA
jgi:hypothetical protein